MRKTSHQEKASISGRMEKAMRANGRAAFSMAKELRSCLMEQSSMVTGTWAYRKALVFASILMEVSMMVIGSMDSLTALERKHYQMGLLTREDGLKEKQEVMALKCFQTELYSKANGKNQNS